MYRHGESVQAHMACQRVHWICNGSLSKLEGDRKARRYIAIAQQARYVSQEDHAGRCLRSSKGLKFVE